MDEIDLTELKQRLLTQDFDVLKLRKKFDLKKYRQITLNSLGQHRPKEKDGYEKYKGLGLQYSNTADPYYDAIDQVAFISPAGKVSKKRANELFMIKNSIGEKYEEFFSHFAPECILTRGRILIAAPGFKMTEHTDGEFCVTLHFAIQTHPDCVMHVGDREYSIPADGHFYAVNVAKPHFVTNRSQIDRIHITYPLTPLHFYRWKRSELIKMDPFFKMFNLTDISMYSHLTIEETEEA